MYYQKQVTVSLGLIFVFKKMKKIPALFTSKRIRLVEGENYRGRYLVYHC